METVVLPSFWKPVFTSHQHQKWFRRLDGLVVIVSEDEMGGQLWLHVSCSYKDKYPKWSDLKEVKDVFMGRERRAYQLLPKQSEIVDEELYCLHLWSSLK